MPYIIYLRGGGKEREREVKVKGGRWCWAGKRETEAHKTLARTLQGLVPRKMRSQREYGHDTKVKRGEMRTDGQEREKPFFFRCSFVVTHTQVGIIRS